MSRFFAGLIVALVSLSAPAYAKQESGCTALLGKVCKAFDEFGLCPLYVKPTVMVQIADNPTHLAKIAEMLIKKVGQTESTVVIFSAEQLRDKRVLKKFQTHRFVVIQTLEGFILDPHDDNINPESIELLRTTLRKRMTDQLPTLILVENVTSVNRYLRNLDSAPAAGKRAQ